MGEEREEWRGGGRRGRGRQSGVYKHTASAECRVSLVTRYMQHHLWTQFIATSHIELSQTSRLPGCSASLQVVDVVEDRLLAELVLHTQVPQVVPIQDQQPFTIHLLQKSTHEHAMDGQFVRQRSHNYIAYDHTVHYSATWGSINHSCATSAI